MSIRARLLYIALLATLLPALLVSWRFVQDREREIASATSRLPRIAAAIGNDIDEKIQAADQLHHGLGRARDLDTSDRAACSGFLSEVRDKYRQYTGILTILPDGQLFCDSLNTGRRLDLNDRAYFRQALQQHDGITMEPVFGRLTGIPVLQIAHPVRTETGELRFVLLASLNLERFVQRDALDTRMPGLDVLLVDHQGLVLSRSSARAGGAEPGASIADSALLRLAANLPLGRVEELAEASTDVRVWAVSRSALLDAAGLHVLVGRSKGDLVAAANRRFAEDMVLVIAIGLMLFVGTGYLAELGIRRHIGAIAVMVKKLGSGAAGVRIPPPHPRGELGALMATLNQTAQSLDQQRADIDTLDAQLRQSQRLESIGQLTGGVAHDFNNLLTVIMGNSELLSEQLRDQPRLAETATMVLKAAQRGADLTQHMLAFARRQPLDPRAVDVAQLVGNMQGLLRRTLGEHIDIIFAPLSTPWAALVDPAQLESALLNLCLNARDAMPQGGRLTIEVANRELDAEYAGRHVEVRPGPYVMLAVSDTGSGIAPEHLARVFEPFYTTKEKGRGTGLGLSMVYGFIKQSGGHINIYSEFGHGTTVHLYLPRADSIVLPAEKEPESIPALGAETILLVEDDDMVRRYAHGQLTQLGYQVLQAPDGPQAMALISTHPEIDLLFTDMVMPGGMGGQQLANEARKLRPGLRVLYTSGYTENAIVHHGRLDPGVLLLHKPYRRVELACKVREALSQD